MLTIPSDPVWIFATGIVLGASFFAGKLLASIIGTLLLLLCELAGHGADTVQDWWRNRRHRPRP